MANYMLGTKEFKTPVYVADVELSEGCQVTDRKNEAAVFDTNHDLIEAKLGYWKAVSGYALEVIFTN